MSIPYILSLDLGTTSNKCTLFRAEDAAVVAMEVVNYSVQYPQIGWAEQSADVLWQSCRQGVRGLLLKTHISANDIVAIGLCGHMNGCLPVDSGGEALYPNIIHADMRSTKESAFIEQEVGLMPFYQLTGNRMDPHFSLPKYLWLKRNQPEIYEKTAFFLNTKDYIYYKLTDRLGVTDYSDASLTCALNIATREWATDLFSTLKLDAQKMPQIEESFNTSATLSPFAAKTLGLKSGIPVAVGGGDGACASRGAGVAHFGTAYNYLGSSSWIAVLHKKLALDKKARTFHFYDLDGQSVISCGTVQSAAASYEWAIDQFCQHEKSLAAQEGRSFYHLIDQLAKNAPAGCDGVFFLPYLMGERTPHWDPCARGAFVGFTLSHGREYLMRAVYEGIGHALLDVLNTHQQNGLSVTSMSLIGGGATSPFWNELLCNMWGIPVWVCDSPGQATSRGAAFAAGVGVGLYPDFATAASLVKPKRQFEPNPLLSALYHEHHKLFAQIYEQLKPIYQNIASTQ